MFMSTSGSMTCQLRPAPRDFTLVLLVVLMGMCQAGSAQTAPVINTTNPASVTAGNPTFTLTVTGSGFLPNGPSTSSVVQINGIPRPTIFKSTLQLTATVFATDIAQPGALLVTVVKIATMAGFEVPPDTSIICAEVAGVGKQHPLSAEKLSPVLSLYFVPDFNTA